MGSDLTAKLDQIVREIGMSDPHIKAVVITAADAIPIRYYASADMEQSVKDLTSRIAIAYSTFYRTATRIAGSQSLEDIMVSMTNEFMIVKPLPGGYIIIIIGGKEANLGLIRVKLNKIAEELKKTSRSFYSGAVA